MDRAFKPYLEGLENDARIRLPIRADLIELPAAWLEMLQLFAEHAIIDHMQRREDEVVSLFLGHLQHAQIPRGRGAHIPVSRKFARCYELRISLTDRRIIRNFFLLAGADIFKNYWSEVGTVGTPKPAND